MAETLTRPQLLEVRNLRIDAVTQTGRRVTLVEDVSFALNKGEVLGLIGAPGAGKSTIGLSTLAYARAGCEIVGGQIAFHGHELRDLNREGRQSLRGAKAAYVAQNSGAAFNPAHTLFDQVCEVALQHGVMKPSQARMEAIRLFRELDLPNPETFGNRYPDQVSPGQLQRAMAAMAMVARPDLVVFDEPTTLLDPTTQVEVLAAFKKLVREHATAAIYVSQDLAVLAQIADRIMVLRAGKVVEQGATEQVLRRPETDFARMLVAERAVARPGAFVEPRAVDATPILELKDVTAVDQDHAPLVDGVSFDLMRGDVLAVVGESGSGKRSLARVVAGLWPRVGGDILLGGASLPVRLADRDRDRHRRIQFIHRQPGAALNPHHTLLKIIGRPLSFYFGKSRSAIRARVAELLQQVDLPPDLMRRRPGDLSAGQQQRAALARALAAEPDVIVCDDVIGTLDPLAADEILRILRRIQSESRVAVLFVTDDLDAARRIANKIAVMLKGQLIAYGPTRQVLSAPLHPYTELLLSSIPEIRTDWLDEALRRRRKAIR